MKHPLSERLTTRLKLAQPLRLTHRQRILRSAEFAHLKETGQRKVRGCLIANWQVNPSAKSSRLGVITSKRIGKAHDRNRARRLLRESFRHLQHALVTPVDIILIARKSIVNKRQTEVALDLLRILKEHSMLEDAEK